MAIRKTIMLDDELVKKIRNIQSKKLRDLNKSVSFSQVINQILEIGLKKY